MTQQTINRLGFIGAGNMAEALLRGILSADLVPADGIIACDPDEKRRRIFSDLGVKVTDRSSELSGCTVLILAVKPQVAGEVLSDIGPVLSQEHLLVSIAAGITTACIAEKVSPGVRIVRVMPNTPMLAGAGASCVAGGKDASDDDVQLVRRLFSCAGTAYEVPEEQMDAVTAVSGSGPAYFFRFVEVLAEAGIAAGLPSDLAGQLASQTAIGAGCLLAQSGESATVLRERVTSPGGTTAAALQSFADNDFPGIVHKAVEAARVRSVELSHSV